MTIGFSHGSEFLDALLASLADAVYLVGPAGEVRFANRAAVELLGYSAEAELLGRPSHATIHSRHPDGSPFPERDCPLLKPRATGETVRVDLDWFVRRDGSFVPVAYTSAPMETTDGRGAVVAFRDLTERLAFDEVAASRARIVAATDAERRRIGRDLHDGAQQRLVSVAIGLNMVAAKLEGDPSSARALLSSARSDLARGLEELRELARGIHPVVLTERGLGPALDALAARAPLPIEVETLPDQRLAPQVEAAAYYVVAEAITNVAKYAHASRATVTIGHSNGTATVTVADDGVGGADPAGGSGLRGLAARVEALNGRLDIDSPPGGGTRIQAEIPLA